LALPTTARNFSSEEPTPTVAEGFEEMINLELENESQDLRGVMSKDLEDLKKSISKKWEITEDMITFLRRNFTVNRKRKKAIISFDTNDVNPKENPNPMQEGVEMQANYDPRAQARPNPEEVTTRFTITVNKATKVPGKTFVFQCIAKEGKTAHGFCIDEIGCFSGDAEAIHKGEVQLLTEFPGRRFHMLRQEVKDAYKCYLETSVGIDKEMVDFIMNYSKHREEKNYTLFLQETKFILLQE
jgi:hypothetical protein